MDSTNKSRIDLIQDIVNMMSSRDVAKHRLKKYLEDKVALYDTFGFKAYNEGIALLRSRIKRLGRDIKNLEERVEVKGGD